MKEKKKKKKLKNEGIYRFGEAAASLALVISGSFLRREKGVTKTWHQERACISKFLFLA